MTYGRLDVYRPDGPIDSYQLSKPNIAIGRSPGNDILLDANAVSRYHATLVLEESRVFLQDLGSINGTYLDGIQIESNQRAELHGGEEIQIGEIRLIYHPSDENPTEPVNVEVTQRIEVEQPTYRVELSGPDQPVTPGVYVQAALLIHNMSGEQDHYFVELDGVPREWVRLERVEVVLDPGDEAHLMISFKPLRRPDSQPGRYPCTVRVRSKSRPTQTVDANLVLTVLSYSGFGFDLGRSEIASGEVVPVHIHNQGNAPLQLSFGGQSQGGGLEFDFQPGTAVLGPGQRMAIRARVRARQRPLLGAPLSHEFAIVARAYDASGFQAAMPGRVGVEPVLSGWRLGAVVGLIGVLVLAVIAVLAAVLAPSPPPSIEGLALSAPEVVQGQPITLRWAARNVSALYIEIDGVAQPNEFGPGDSSLDLTVDSPGPHQITLVAVNGSEIARSSADLTVHPLLSIGEFSAVPSKLIRYITQDVLVNWNVSGGTRVRLQGLEPITGQPDSTEFNPADSLVISLTAYDVVTLRLLAEGGGGQTAEQTLALPVEDPACRVLAAETALRTGPSGLHQVMATAGVDQIVTPDRRDGSATWLRVFAPGGGPETPRLWLPVEAVVCLNVEPGQLPIDPAPPTPVPTVTLVPTETAIPTATLTATHQATATRTHTATPTPTRLPSATPPATWTATPTVTPRG